MTVFALVGIVVIVAGLALLVQGIQGQQRKAQSLGGLLMVAGAAVAVLSSAFVVVPAGNVGVVFNIFGGVQSRPLGEGLHFVLPMVQQVTLYDVRQQELTLAAATGDKINARSAEGLEIDVDVTVLYQVIRERAPQLHQDIGPLYMDVRIRPEVRSQIRDGISEYRAADLISVKRAELQQQIQNNLV